MLKVLDELYSGMDNAPPVFLVAHGLGALITLKFLLLNDRYKDLTGKIKAIGYFNPFFSWSNPGEMATTVSFFKVAWNLLKMQGAGEEFNRQRANEQKFENYQIPKHELHWVYDADNSI